MLFLENYINVSSSLSSECHELILRKSASWDEDCDSFLIIINFITNLFGKIGSFALLMLCHTRQFICFSCLKCCYHADREDCMVHHAISSSHSVVVIAYWINTTQQVDVVSCYVHVWGSSAYNRACVWILVTEKVLQKITPAFKLAVIVTFWFEAEKENNNCTKSYNFLLRVFLLFLILPCFLLNYQYNCI
jgi:hypothetical protein